MGCSAEPDRDPPVVLLSIDTLRRDFVGAYGDPHARTPSLDRLARTGVTFADAISTTSWTLPSHLSMLTGQYPSSHGVIGDGRSLPEEKVTLAELLRDRGYATGGFVSGPYLHRAYGFAQGFDVYQHCVNYGEELDEGGHVANVVRVNQRSHDGVTSPKLYSQVFEWLEGVRPAQSYFLFVHHWDPHYDFVPEAPWDRVFDPSYAGNFRSRGFLKNRRIVASMSRADRARLLNLYRGEIAYTDRWIGALFRQLVERGDFERSFVVLVADHGEEFFEHGNKGHRNNLYEETLEVPLIVRGAGEFTGGGVVREAASVVDLLATVMELVGEKIPVWSQGASLQSVRDGDAGPRPIFAELHDQSVAVRHRGWKAIRDLQSGVEELYSLTGDPRERRDVRETRSAAFDSLGRWLDSGEIGRFAPDSVATATVDPSTEAELRALGYTD
jgi:arylsulfatase A-like enzyme